MAARARRLARNVIDPAVQDQLKKAADDYEQMVQTEERIEAAKRSRD